MRWTDRIGRRLNPHDLHVFMAVVEQGNMARAADALAISRPVVSRTIANLEQTLGVRLLDRGPQGVEPTLYGRALLKRSVAVFDELKQSVQDIEFLTDPNSGEVRVGCSEPLAAGLVSAVIDRLSQRYPRLVYHLEIGTPATLRYRLLRERKCDLVVSRRGADAPEPEPDVDMEVLFEDDIRVVAGPRSKWLGRRGLKLADLVDEPWILAPTDHDAGTPVFEMFRAGGLRVPRATRAQLFAQRAQQPVGDRALSRRGAGLGAAVRRRACAAQGAAAQAAALAVAGGGYDAEGPHAQSRRAAVHRMRPRGGGAIGQGPTAGRALSDQSKTGKRFYFLPE